MQIPSQDFETPIVIGELAVSIRVTEHQIQHVCLGIFSEEDRAGSPGTEEHSNAASGCSPGVESTDRLAT